MSKTVAQQMTDHEFTAAIDSKVARDMPFSALTFAAGEALRARAAEARLLEENRKQAEQIKALADALNLANRFLPPLTGQTESVILSALRLVGR